MSPTLSFPAWGLAKGLGIPRESEDLWDWTVGLLQNGRNKNSTLRGHKENHVHTRTQGEGSVSQKTEPDNPVSVGGSPTEVWVGSGLLHGPWPWQ